MSVGRFGICCCQTSSVRIARARKEIFGGLGFTYGPNPIVSTLFRGGGPQFAGGLTTLLLGNFDPGTGPAWCGLRTRRTVDGVVDWDVKERVDWSTGAITTEIIVPPNFEPLPDGTLTETITTEDHYQTMLDTTNGHRYVTDLTLSEGHTWDSALADVRSLCLAALAHEPRGHYQVRVQLDGEPSPGTRVFSPIPVGGHPEAAHTAPPAVDPAVPFGRMEMQVAELVADSAALLHYGRNAAGYLLPARCSEWTGELVEAEVWRKSAFSPPADPEVYAVGVISIAANTDCAGQTLIPPELVI